MTAIRLQVTGGSALAPYVATSPSGKTVGELHRNWLPRQPLELRFEGRTYRIEHRVVSNRFVNNDFRFELVGADGVLATAIKRVGEKAFDIAIGEETWRLVNRNRWLSMHFTLETGSGRELGGIEETTGFSLWRRRFELRMPEAVGGPVALFLFFLAANHTYS